MHYKISALGKMHIVEPLIPAVVKAIQQMKIKSIVLTSRGSVLRSDIESELSDADLEFKSRAFGPEGGFASTFLTEGFDKAREISFMDGVVMGSGQIYFTGKNSLIAQMSYVVTTYVLSMFVLPTMHAVFYFRNRRT